MNEAEKGCLGSGKEGQNSGAAGTEQNGLGGRGGVRPGKRLEEGKPLR